MLSYELVLVGLDAIATHASTEQSLAIFLAVYHTGGGGAFNRVDSLGKDFSCQFTPSVENSSRCRDGT